MVLFVAPAFSQTPPNLSKRSASIVASDHRALAAEYRAHAIEHETDAAAHEALVAELRARLNDDDAWDLARDATHYVEHSRQAAEALRDLAALHEALAERLAPATTEAAPESKTPEGKGCCAKHMTGKAKVEPAAPTHDHAAK
jgi:hypothetical protein